MSLLCVVIAVAMSLLCAVIVAVVGSLLLLLAGWFKAAAWVGSVLGIFSLGAYYFLVPSLVQMFYVTIGALTLIGWIASVIILAVIDEWEV